MLIPQKVIDIAISQIGYTEGANNNTKYAKELDAVNYYNYPKYNSGAGWCSIFVDWCIFKAADDNKDRALSASYEPKKDNCGAGCKESAAYFRKAGAWTKTAGVGYKVFFGKEGKESHTGLVVSVGVTTIDTVEGNAGNKVKRRSYSKSDKSIAGYGIINYDTEPTPTPTPPTPSKDSYTVKTNSGDSLRLRSQPTTKSDKVANIPNKTKLVADEVVRGESIGGVDTWIKTTYSGKTGYASGKYLTPTPVINQSQPIEPPTEDVKPIESDYVTYKIQKGDTLSKIAKRYGTTVKAIKALNPQIKNANLIITGDTIKIPS